MSGEDWPDGWAEENANAADPGAEGDWWEGYEPLGMVEGDSPEIIHRKLNDYVREHFSVVREEITADGARFTELTRIREPYAFERTRTHTHCTCAWIGILDPTIVPVMVYSRDCGLPAHRLKAQTPRQEP
jgi:hypothetical protein